MGKGISPNRCNWRNRCCYEYIIDNPGGDHMSGNPGFFTGIQYSV